MVKIDIFSGFLGAGKTTLIKKLISDAYKGEKLVLIENEFGEIGIDSGFLKDSGIEINQMNSGCICCSLVGDFSKALVQVAQEFNPDRILIEPSGVGKLSDVIKAVKNTKNDNLVLNSFTTVADANKCKMYMKNFGEFFNDQIENAGCIILSHTENISEEKLENCVSLLKKHNDSAVIVTTPHSLLTGEQLLSAIEKTNTVENELKKLQEEHEHHHHEHDEHCCCHEHHHHEHEHDHHHDEECDCHEHNHEHHHDENCCCHGDEHHHEHSDDCGCHGHHHEHGHHHADDVFTSWGEETSKKYTKNEIENILSELENEEKYGIILRAKGIVNSKNEWIHFDYIPGESDVRNGSADITGKICVIGSNINEENLKNLFML